MGNVSLVKQLSNDYQLTFAPLQFVYHPVTNHKFIPSVYLIISFMANLTAMSSGKGNLGNDSYFCMALIRLLKIELNCNLDHVFVLYIYGSKIVRLIWIKAIRVTAD